mmetsp:Transcript_29439/g.77825  ORF Transcript_29439/g.77825 Transcript_29439/m.77825 type:complete len:212 (-) Transcript_29439:174-809(-)
MKCGQVLEHFIHAFVRDLTSRNNARNPPTIRIRVRMFSDPKPHTTQHVVDPEDTEEETHDRQQHSIAFRHAALNEIIKDPQHTNESQKPCETEQSAQPGKTQHTEWMRSSVGQKSKKYVGPVADQNDQIQKEGTLKVVQCNLARSRLQDSIFLKGSEEIHRHVTRPKGGREKTRPHDVTVELQIPGQRVRNCGKIIYQGDEANQIEQQTLR